MLSGLDLFWKFIYINNKFFGIKTEIPGLMYKSEKQNPSTKTL